MEVGLDPSGEYQKSHSSIQNHATHKSLYVCVCRCACAIIAAMVRYLRDSHTSSTVFVLL